MKTRTNNGAVIDLEDKSAASGGEITPLPAEELAVLDAIRACPKNAHLITRQFDRRYAIMDGDKELGIGDLPAAAWLNAAAAYKSAEFYGQLMADWYECAAYGDQVPKELPSLLSRLLTEHGNPTDDGKAWDIITESAPDEAWCQLFECVFLEGARYALSQMANAVFDGDNVKLERIDLQYIGVINHAAQEAEGNCKSQHIMHQNFGGPKIFREIDP
ncbi:MAG: hypothetical protein V4819_19275 [Verrucomicrobiota bacterium]